MCGINHEKNQDKFKINRQYWGTVRKTKITNKASEEIYKQSDKEISVSLVPATTNNNEQVVMPKNMVPDPG